MIEHTEKMEFERLVPNQESPGEMLKRAREEKKFSHIDVAKQLKLRVQWIVDIENDHYQDASALIYVRGYLRSYARLVSLSPDKVLASFSEMNFDEPFKARKSTQGSEEQFVMQRSILSSSKARKSVGGKIVRWVTVFVVLLLIALVVMWWRGQRMLALQSDQLSLPVKSAEVMSSSKVTQIPMVVQQKK